MNEPLPLDRRRFIVWASSLLVAHYGTSEEPRFSRSEERPQTGPRITSLELLTAAPLATMKRFYGESLGLSVLDERRDRLTVAAGATRLTFVAAGAEDGQPFYHFAFNIPENKILAALEWQKQRSPLMPVPERLRDSSNPQVVNFSHWNAHSVFFYDPAGNVVEYIARHDLKNSVPGGFGSADILYASEIAWIVDEVAATASTLKKVAGVEQYRGASDDFAAIGDERGLLLVMKRGRTLNFNPTDPTKAARIFRTTARVRGVERTSYRFPGLPYEISVDL